MTAYTLHNYDTAELIDEPMTERLIAESMGATGENGAVMAWLTPDGTWDYCPEHERQSRERRGQTLRCVYVMPSTTCACGEVTGERCASTEPAKVTVEWMPIRLRASHEAAGNRGAYPANGARRFLVTLRCAYDLLASDGGWTLVVAPRGLARAIENGRDDAETWLGDEPRDNWAAAIRPGTLGADEGLINAIGMDEVGKLFGMTMYLDGVLRPEAYEALGAYSWAWEQRVREELARDNKDEE